MSLAGLILLAAGLTAPTGDTVPLFASHEVLDIRLVADFDAIRGDRDDDPRDRPGYAVLSGGDSVAVEVRPRGNFRRDPAFCSFPPLRLDVKSRSAEGTVFEGQDKLKVVVPCHPLRESYQEYLLREYLLYRAYALLTDVSFQVRLARITFEDVSGRMESFTVDAFFIESDVALARRVRADLLDVPDGKVLRADLLHPRASSRVALFEYMIGNTDWADARVHNMSLLGMDGRVVPVPYDFDLSGAVNAAYATPDRDLPIENVRQRLYMGWCWPGQEAEGVIQPFLDARPRLGALIDDFTRLAPEARADMAEYLLHFYDVVATPERAEQRVFRDCREMGVRR
jgi:hypothetical protein